MTVSVREAYAIWKRDFRRGRLLGDYGDFNARFREMAYSTGLMALPAGWTLPRWSMFGGRVGSVLGSRASIGGVLGSGRGGAAAAWYLAGGVSAANCVAAYQSKGAASLSASYTNLANPGTYNAAPGVAPTFDTATGWTFAAAPLQYLRTGILPDNTYSVLVQFSGISNDGGLLGKTESGGTAKRFFLRANNSIGQRAYANDVAYAVSGILSAGNMAMAGKAAYYNGTADGTIGGGAFTSASGYDILIGAINTGSAVLPLSGNISAVAIYNVTLTAPQVAAISSAMSAL